jgi:hypothetical protein
MLHNFLVRRLRRDRGAAIVTLTGLGRMEEAAVDTLTMSNRKNLPRR